jgi:8-oxo-dGTP pyrophosphatase MutT (NUDIX family)
LIHVASGVITKGDRIFLQQRHPKKEYGGCWECPGGKKEVFDKTIQNTLVRELGEELNWVDAMGTIADTPLLTTVFHPPEVKDLLQITFFHIEWDWELQAIKPRYAQDILGSGWFTFGELSALEMTPGNARLRRFLQTHTVKMIEKHGTKHGEK